jgi:uncharacterized protein (DUF58 family)
MASLLIKVRRKMSIAAHRRVRTALEGDYASVTKGRSMDFDDLREYILGDDVKDIDWKATARTGSVRIRRYVAIRKHNILLVVDTGRSMAATAPSGESKKDIAVMAAGVIASVVQKHADLIGLTAGSGDYVYHMPLKGSRTHIERILQYIDTRTTLDAPTSNLTNLLDHVRRTIRRRMMLIVISDNLQFAEAQEQLLRRLGAQHELIFIAIDDLDPSADNWNNRGLYDVDEPSVLPLFVRRQKGVEHAYQVFLQKERLRAYRTLKHIQISSIRINNEEEVVNKIVRLLEDHKHAKRRKT